MRIRKLPKLTELWEGHLDSLDREAFPTIPPYPKEGAIWWVVGDDAGVLVGFAGLKVLKGSLGFLCRVAMKKSHRGLGLQKRLIRARIKEAKKQGCTHVITYVHPDNLASANSLISCGMKLYTPQNPYGVPGALYFIRRLN
jgi:RimJ/RimL family protein N-acetyltransferase